MKTLQHRIRLCFLLVTAALAATSMVRADETGAARGAALLMPFKQELKQALLAGLEEGPENAISVCKDQAPMIARTLSVNGVKVGRSSHRLRNPENTAPDWVSPILAAYVQAESERAPVAIPLAGERVGYVEPLIMQPLCLACHGDALAPNIASRITKEYPHDQATGFEVGDLRGVFWVEFPADQSGAP